MESRLLLAFTLSLFLYVACSAESSDSLKVGQEGPGGSATGSAGKGAVEGGSGGETGGGSSTGVSGAGSQQEALSVHVEDIQGLAVEIVTVACPGDCVEVEAVARGGNSPYEYRWEDGSTSAERTLCPEATSEYSVTANDTAIAGGDEFEYLGQTATAKVTAEVLDCPDDGTDGGVDAGSGDNLCLDNLSFEGRVTPTHLETIDAPPWDGCYAGGHGRTAIADPNLFPESNWIWIEPSDGATYLAVGGDFFGSMGVVSQTLCTPIAAGETASFRIDVARALCEGYGCVNQPGQMLEILGGSPCQPDTVLWTSPELAPTWSTHCVTIQPQQDVGTLSFRVRNTAPGLMWAAVDNIVPVASCD